MKTMKVKKQYPEPVRYSSLEDLRIWAKNLWKENSKDIQKFFRIKHEEDFYIFLDDDLLLFAFLEGTGRKFEIISNGNVEINFEIYSN